MNATTTTHAGLLAAICEDPSDDTPRLVLADWLEENGEPERAQFIRLQIRLAALHPSPADYRKAANMMERYCKGAPVPLKANTAAVLLVRESLLLAKYSREWAKPIIQLLWGDGPRGDESLLAQGWIWGFHRGFVAGLRCTAAEWLAHGSAIVAAAPIERVTLSDKTPRQWNEADKPPAWHWTRGGSAPSSLPSELLQAMPVYCFDSVEQANEAISTACLAWARSAKVVQP